MIKRQKTERCEMNRKSFKDDQEVGSMMGMHMDWELTA